MLRKARNSKVLRVSSMQDVMSFDKHIQRCLSVKEGDRDTAMKRMVMRQNGIDNLLIPSLFNSSALNISNSQESNIGDVTPKVHEKSIIMTNAQQRTSCDVIAERMQQNKYKETDSTPSLSVTPSMVLHPKQEDATEEGKSNSTRKRSKASSKRFILNKGRNYSTLSRP